MQLTMLRCFNKGACVPWALMWISIVSIVVADPTVAGQEQAIHRLYESLDGPNWTPQCRENWLNNRTQLYCNGGIACYFNETLRIFVVKSIILYECNLGGSLPQELLNLEHLEILDISRNPRLQGSLPQDFDNVLIRLRNLNMGSTSMHGPLPEGIGNLVMLDTLGLHDLYLSGTIPNWWGTNLVRLRLLDLCGGPSRDYGRHRLTGTIPSTFKNAHEMIIFKICYQDISGTIPDEMIASWPRLIDLSLKQNQLVGTLPQSLIHCVNLSALELQNNSFSGPFLPLGSGPKPQPRLRVLGFGYNRLLTGTIPTTLGLSVGVSEVYFEESYGLSGTIPDSFRNFTSLRYFRLTCSRITGTLPEYFRTFPGMVEVKIVNNSFITGTLHVSWRSLTKLTTLELGENNLEGSIPNEWFAFESPSQPGMASLTMLRLSYNRLSGTIPEAVTRNSLLGFSVNDNHFSGTFPESLATMHLLEDFNMHNNSFTGTLSPLFSNWTRMRVFSVAENNLEGTLPPEYGVWGSLRTFYVANNRFHGQLPNTYGSLASLRITRFEGNNFSGTLPASWSGLSNVIQLSLQDNRLQGTLPPQWSLLVGISSIFLFNNSLTGTIPISWRALVQAFIVLTDNYLTGTLPVEFTQQDCPLLVIAVSQNCLTIADPPPWWALRIQAVSPQRDPSECSTSTSTPAPSLHTPVPSANGGVNRAPGFQRSATVAMATTVPLLVLAGAMPSASSQRALLQFSLVACTLDLSETLDLASSPLQIEFGQQQGAAIRGAVIGNMILLLSVGAVGCVAAAVMVLMRSKHAGRGGRTRDRRGLGPFLLSCLHDLRFPGVVTIPFVFLAQPMMTFAVILLGHSPDGGRDITVGVVALVVTAIGALSFVYALWRLRTDAKYTPKRFSRRTQPRKPVTRRAPYDVAIMCRNWLVENVFHHQAGHWSNTKQQGGGTTGSEFVGAWGSVFDGYRGSSSCWGCVPAACVRSFGAVELIAAIVYGVIGGVVPVVPAGDGDSSSVSSKSGERDCQGLMVGMLVVAVCHAVAMLLTWPYISRWESIMGVLPTLLGVLWAIFALAGVGDAVLDSLSEAQVWLFMVAVAANFVTLISCADWIATAKRVLLGHPRDPPPCPTDTATKLSFHPKRQKGKPRLLTDLASSGRAEINSLQSLADVVKLICSHRRSGSSDARSQR